MCEGLVPSLKSTFLHSLMGRVASTLRGMGSGFMPAEIGVGAGVDSVTKVGCISSLLLFWLRVFKASLGRVDEFGISSSISL